MSDADVRITKALSLIDTWLHDESPRHDDFRQRCLWRNVREIRAALEGEQ